MQIEDGAGSGKRAQVDENLRIQAYSVSVTGQEANAELGRTYNINTGTVTLTTANKSAVMYVKNNGREDLKITTIGYLLGNSTGGSGDLLAEVIRNPTTGTIIDNEVAVDVESNKNFGSTNTLEVDAYKGVEGDTITNGTVAFPSLIAGSGRVYLIQTGSVVLPQGASLGVNITPQASNTDMDVQVFLSVQDDRL